MTIAEDIRDYADNTPGLRKGVKEYLLEIATKVQLEQVAAYASGLETGAAEFVPSGFFRFVISDTLGVVGEVRSINTPLYAAYSDVVVYRRNTPNGVQCAKDLV